MQTLLAIIKNEHLNFNREQLHSQLVFYFINRTDEHYTSFGKDVEETYA